MSEGLLGIFVGRSLSLRIRARVLRELHTRLLVELVACIRQHPHRRLVWIPILIEDHAHRPRRLDLQPVCHFPTGI